LSYSRINHEGTIALDQNKKWVNLESIILYSNQIDEMTKEIKLDSLSKVYFKNTEYPLDSSYVGTILSNNDSKKGSKRIPMKKFQVS